MRLSVIGAPGGCNGRAIAALACDLASLCRRVRAVKPMPDPALSLARSLRLARPGRVRTQCLYPSYSPQWWLNRLARTRRAPASERDQILREGLGRICKAIHSRSLFAVRTSRRKPCHSKRCCVRSGRRALPFPPVSETRKAAKSFQCSVKTGVTSHEEFCVVPASKHQHVAVCFL